MTPLNVLLQIQATGTAVADSTLQVAPETVEMSYWEMAQKGGPWIMIPMLIMSFIAVYIFIERWVAIKKASWMEKLIRLPTYANKPIPHRPA